MITRKSIDEVIEAARIDEVVEDFITLRRRGVNKTGLCPFHSEKSPSFSVNVARNIFKCFGCGKGGDPISFIREHENMGYLDAIRWLAKKYRIQLEEVELTKDQLADFKEQESLYLVNDFAVKYYAQQMRETDIGRSVALPYFAKRGLSEETIEAFGLGFATDSRDGLIQEALKAGYSKETLIKIGLTSKDGSRDFFRDRVIFPIHALSGKICAFAGRTMSSEKTIPKYINSPETEIYVKNKILYGAFQAKQHIRKLEECLLVEGYMDVISLHQAGVNHAVAASGTALTEGQIQLIRRQTDNLTLLYDADNAGFNAAVKGFGIALKQGMNVRMVSLPAGEDPDSYVQANGRTAILDYIKENQKDIVIFLAEKRLAEVGRDPIKRANLLREIAEIIAQCPDAVRRSVYIRECHEILDVNMEALVMEVNKIIKREVSDWQKKREKAPESASDNAEQAPPDIPENYAQEQQQQQVSSGATTRGDVFQERDMIRILILFGDRKIKDDNITVAEYVLADIEDAFEHFDDSAYGKLAKLCHARVLNHDPLSQDFFLQNPDKQLSKIAFDLLAEPWDYSPNWEDRWQYPLQNQPMPDQNEQEDMLNSLLRFKLRKLMKMCEVNLGRIKQTSQAGDMETMMHYMRIQQKMLEARNELAKKTGTVLLR
jgi:DNA primase